MIWSVIMLFAQDSPRLWAFLPNSTGTFPHKDEQFCSSLWAEMLIMMSKIVKPQYESGFDSQ